MPAKTTMQTLLLCAAICVSVMADRAAFAQRRGGGGRTVSRSRSSARSSSVRYSGRSASRMTASRTTRTRTTATTTRRTTATTARRTTATSSRYGSVRHSGTATGGAVRTRYGGAAHVEGPRGREASVVRTPWGSRAHVEGYGGREVTARRGPYGGGVHAKGLYGREGAAVWGRNGAVVAGRGPRGGAVAVGGNYYRGGVVVRRPAGYSTVIVGGGTYYGWGGHCYRRAYYNGSVTYVGVHPPYGWVVVSLPARYETVVISSTTYYVSDDVYYVQRTSAGKVTYVVSEPPASETPKPTGPDPFSTLRRMSDYLGKCPQFSVATVDTMDDTLPTGQKIQLQTRRTIEVKRPNLFRVDVDGDVANRQIVYDGRTVTWLDRKEATYGTIDAPKQIDEVLDLMAERYGVAVPLADLFYSSPYDAILPATETGRHLGKVKLEGVECDHLVFEGQLIDWQIWIETGDRPLPRKMVITYKTAEGAPRYRATLNDWNLSPRFSSNLFEFQPPKGATRLDVLPANGG